eukprot:609939-Pyramimonas_sp.AAC.1
MGGIGDARGVCNCKDKGTWPMYYMRGGYGHTAKDCAISWTAKGKGGGGWTARRSQGLPKGACRRIHRGISKHE